MGWGCQPTRMVLLEDCRVPAANLLGAEGQGFSLAMQGRVIFICTAELACRMCSCVRPEWWPHQHRVMQSRRCAGQPEPGCGAHVRPPAVWQATGRKPGVCDLYYFTISFLVSHKTGGAVQNCRNGSLSQRQPSGSPLRRS